MKTIIFGGREIRMTVQDLDTIVEEARPRIIVTEVVSGGARGMDKLGEAWAKANNIPIKPFYVSKDDWLVKGRGAGILRNGDMERYGGAGIGAWDGKTTGTANMIARLIIAEKPLYLWRTDRSSGSFIEPTEAAKIWARRVLKFGFK